MHIWYSQPLSCDLSEVLLQGHLVMVITFRDRMSNKEVKTKYPNSRLVFLSLLPRTVCSCTKPRCKACDTFKAQSLETLVNKVDEINT